MKLVAPSGLLEEEVRIALDAVLCGLEQTTEAVSVIDFDGRVRFANASAARLLGRPSSEVVGRYAWEVEAGLTPTRFRANWAYLEAHGELSAVRHGVDASGLWKHVEARVVLASTPTGRFAVSSMRDVTAAHEAAKALAAEQAERKREHAFLQALVRNMGDAVIVADLEQRITAYSGAAEALYGWSEAEVLGRRILDFETDFPEGDRELHHGRVGRGEATRAYLRVKRKDGTWIDLDVRFDLLRDATGRVTHLLSVARDMTEQKATERALREAVQNVKALSGLLPICAWCKKVRDDAGYWQEIEQYLGAHSDAQLSHGMCPDCAKSWK